MNRREPMIDDDRSWVRNVGMDISRVLIVLWVALKYGLFPWAGRIALVPLWRDSFPVRLRKAIEQLGLTYLKLGQYLAVRFDVLPPEVCRELGKLFDRVGPMPFAEARNVIEEEFTESLDDLFESFEREPIAAASVGQVHIAHTWENQRVAVKVQRNGLKPIFLADIRNMKRTAAVVDRLGLFGNLSARGMVGEFELWTLRELDFTLEGRTADRVLRESPPYASAPAIFWELTTPRVLTMEFIEGVGVSEAGQLIRDGRGAELADRLANFDQQTVLQNFVRASLTQLFVSGFFHADAHPGNVFFTDDNIVVFLDFGIFGEVTEEERAVAAGQIESLALGNISESFRYYTKQLLETPDTDPVAVREECIETLTRWYRNCMNPNLPIEERHISRYVGEMIEISRRNGLRFGLNYLLFWRAINALNATAWHVDDNFDVLAEMRVFFEERMPRASERVADVLTDPGWKTSLRDFAYSTPDRITTTLDHLAADGRPWNVTLTDSKRLQESMRSDVWWITAGILFVSLMVWISNERLDPWLRGSVASVVSVFFVVAKRWSK